MIKCSRWVRVRARGVFLASLVTALLLGTEVLLAETEAVPPLTLVSLKIRGARTVPAAKVREELSIPLPSPWPWKKAPRFRASDLEADLERLQRFYRRHGFYQARIRPEIEKDEQGRVRVLLHIEEGPWIKVTEIAVEIADPALKPQLADLEEKWPLKAGSRFTEDSYESLKRLYLEYLNDHGFPRAKVQGKVYLDDRLNTASIHLTVSPGPLCYFGEVDLKGARETPDYLILRKLTFKKGEVFSLAKIYESQKRLYALDLFRSVSLTPEEVPEDQRLIPVKVEVLESKKRSLRVGLGYGDEDQLRVRLGLRWRNLAGGGRLLELDTKYSSLEARLMGTFLNPQIWATYWDLFIQTGWIRRDLPGFNDRAYFTQARLEREVPWHLRFYVGHGLEFARPFDIPTETLILLKESDTGKTFTSSMLQLGVRQDTADNLVDPTRGWIWYANGELAPDFLGSNLQYVRLVAEARKYQRVGKTGAVLAGRLKFGIIEPIQSTEEIAIFKRFFSGGANSVRGYRLDRLGPRTATGDPIGGQALLEGSIEARLPIYKQFRGVTFLDFGNVYLRPRDLDPGQLKYSAGFGFRYSTPIGPIGVDLGFPLNRIDPRRDPSYQIHFTIGQVF